MANFDSFWQDFPFAKFFEKRYLTWVRTFESMKPNQDKLGTEE